MAVQIGIGLYSVRKELQEDPKGTLKKLCEIGFHHFEPANSHAATDPGLGVGLTAEEVNEILSPYGAGIRSTHIGPINEETLPGIIKFHQAVGNRDIVRALEFYTSYDNIMRRCEDFNRYGKYLVEHGMNKLCYHNHYHEFQEVNGKPILYHLLENTDPQYFCIEMDTGWDIRGGRDPIAEMRYVGDRLHLIHIKDFTHRPPNLLYGKTEWINWDNFSANNQPGDTMTPEDFCPIGQGMMPIQEILRTADELGVAAAVLEQDETSFDIFENIAASMARLKTMDHVKI